MRGEGFFNWPAPYVQEFLGKQKLKLTFIPFAGVTIGYDEYFQLVKSEFEKLGFEINSIHEAANKEECIAHSEGIVIGGGNTFHLLHELMKYDLLGIIKTMVQKGTPFIGWSAGANMACPTIKTTNDMPIIHPGSFNALDLIPFQINPHFTDKTIQGHGGESREMRITEYLKVNQNRRVVGLPEGNLILQKGNSLKLLGSSDAILFEYNVAPRHLKPGDNIDFLLD